jgi:ArsR family transcriptional regulator
MLDSALLARKTSVYRAMGDPNRLRIMQLLFENGELCVCEISKHLSAEQPNISKHLAVLRNADIVSMRREGTKIFYTLECRCLMEADRCLERTLRKTARQSLAAVAGS